MEVEASRATVDHTDIRGSKPHNSDLLTQNSKTGKEESRGKLGRSSELGVGEMPKKGHTEEQIVALLRQVEAGARVTGVCRKVGISEATYYLVTSA